MLTVITLTPEEKHPRQPLKPITALKNKENRLNKRSSVAGAYSIIYWSGNIYVEGAV